MVLSSQAKWLGSVLRGGFRRAALPQLHFCAGQKSQSRRRLRIGGNLACRACRLRIYAVGASCGREGLGSRFGILLAHRTLDSMAARDRDPLRAANRKAPGLPGRLQALPTDERMTVHWKSHLWRNAITNYLRVWVRMVTGLVMFRLLFENLSTEEVGYWALLWSVFGYTILMDFGLGLAAQRESAYRSTTGEWEHLSQLLSTMVWTFIGLGLLILIFFAIIQPYFLEWIHISPANRASFGIAYWYFFGALAVSFPLGIFPEMLAGMQRLDLANWTQIISSIVSTILVYAAVRLHWT